MIYPNFGTLYAAGLVDFSKRKVWVALVSDYAFDDAHTTLAEVGDILAKAELKNQRWEKSGGIHTFRADSVVWDRSFEANGLVYYFADDGMLMDGQEVMNPPIFRVDMPDGVLRLIV